MRSSPGNGASAPPLKKYVTCAYFSGSAARRLRMRSCTIAKHHDVECLSDAFPPAVPVHGEITAADARDFAYADNPHLLLQLFHVSGAAGRQRVTSIHERVHEDAIYSVLLRHPEQG